MQLAHPHALWLLLILPLLAAVWLFGRGRPALSFPSVPMLAALPKGGATFAKITGIVLRLAVVALVIVALAQPRWPDETTRLPAQSHAIQMVLDVSGSMTEKDFNLQGRKVSRLDAAKLAFHQFVQGGGEGLPGRADDQIGLVTFAAWPEGVFPPTLSHSLVLKMLDEAQPPKDDPRDATTDIGDAMAQGLELLRFAKPQHKIMILLTDGEHNVPPEVNPTAKTPRQAALIAEALDVRVYTIYTGPDVPSERSRQAEEALRDVAERTGGRFFRASDAQGLVDIYREIDQLEPTRVESFQYYRYHEAYPWVGLACLVLMMGTLALEGSRWLRVP